MRSYGATVSSTAVLFRRLARLRSWCAWASSASRASSVVSSRTLLSCAAVDSVVNVTSVAASTTSASTITASSSIKREAALVAQVHGDHVTGPIGSDSLKSLSTVVTQ